jgi:hypothetical protein
MPPLRHLVFFKFLASSTPEQQLAVKNALSELPSIIPNILFYKVYPLAHNLYPNHSPLNRGYTLLIDSIFTDQSALSVYAPHPAHQGVISKFIAPIRDDNLVIDYELPDRFNLDAFKQLQSPPHIRHLVLYKPKDEVKDEVATINQELEQLQVSIPTILSTSTGQQRTAQMYDGYNDRSKGIHNVVDMVMKDGQGLGVYIDHADHHKFVKKRGKQLEVLMTFDYEA